MKRLTLILAFAVLVLPLVVAGPAGAYKIYGAHRTVGEPGYGTASMAVDRAQIAAYVAAARPLYAQLAACSSSCDRMDFPPHRCPACASATADLKRIAARATVVQARLAKLDVPDKLVTTHSDLIAAASTIKVSASYMAATVLTAPRKLLVATYASPARGRGGVKVVWRPSPTIVRDATYASLTPARVATFTSPRKGRGGVTTVWRELPGTSPEARVAELDLLGPAGVQRAAFVRARWAAVAEMQRAGPDGTPAQQTMAYLVMWRDGVRAQAQAAGLHLPPG
jgi:hypothetical protein